MSLMFEDCSSLTNLDLSSFNTSNVTSMGGMFGSCSSLISLNLSSFDTSNITSFNHHSGGLFNGCNNLKTLYINNFNFNKYSSTGFLRNNLPADVHIYTNQDIATWLQENEPTYTNITVV